MRHIEEDECSVIRVTDFRMQRAERQIQKDAWEEETAPFGVKSPSSYRSLPQNLHNGVDLMDLNSALASDRPLHVAGVSSAAPQGPPNSNLLDLENATEAVSNLDLNAPSQAIGQAADRAPEHSNNPHVNRWLHDLTHSVQPTSDNSSDLASMYNKPQTTSDVAQTDVPPITQATPNNSAPHQHINFRTHSLVPSTQNNTERYWDPLHQVYRCPSSKCKRDFSSAQDFRTHLITSAHVGGQVTCPKCLKKFTTAAAWVAHSESASKKCDIRNSYNYNQVMREITGGVLGTAGFEENGGIKFVAPKIEEWQDD
jgi:hypothetical protein